MKSKIKSFKEFIGELICHSFKMVMSGGKRVLLLSIGIFLCVSLLSFVSLTMTNEYGKIGLSFSGWNDSVCLIRQNKIPLMDLAEITSMYPYAINPFFYGSISKYNDTSSFETIGVGENFLDSFIPCENGDSYLSQLIYGRCFSLAEIQGYESAAIITESGSLIVFGKADGTGEILTLGTGSEKKEYLVVGVIRDSYNSAVQYNEYLGIKDNKNIFLMSLYTPLANVERNGTDYCNCIAVYSLDGTALDISRIKECLNSILDYSCSFYTIESAHEQYKQNIDTFYSNYIPIVVIILAVEVVIMLIFILFSIKERVREIGIRKAVGADNKDITLQFMIENIILALFISLAGCLTGMLIYFISQFVAIYGDYFVFTEVPVQTVLEIGCFSIAFISLTAIIPGIIAGKIKIADALRFE